MAEEEMHMAELTDKGERVLSRFLSLYGAKGRRMFKSMFEGGALEGVLKDEEKFREKIGAMAPEKEEPEEAEE